MKIPNPAIRRTINRISQLVGRREVVFPMIPADTQILFYKRDRADFGFLSNFYISPVVIDNVRWPHTEAYYQGQKSLNPKYHSEILRNEKPSWSKYVGDSRIGDPQIAEKSWFRRYPEDLRDDWDDVKLQIMRSALQAKFSQHAVLCNRLLQTEEAHIIEDSDCDAFWGWGPDHNGRNWLGVLLMECRAALRQQN